MEKWTSLLLAAKIQADKEALRKKKEDELRRTQLACDRVIAKGILNSLDSVKENATEEDTWYISLALDFWKNLGQTHTQFIQFSRLIDAVKNGKPAWTVASLEMRRIKLHLEFFNDK